MTDLASHLGVFLREHLPRDRNANHHSVQSYADSFQLLACFAAERLGVRPCRIEIEQLTAPLILDFLDNLERERNNTDCTHSQCDSTCRSHGSKRCSTTHDSDSRSHWGRSYDTSPID